MPLRLDSQSADFSDAFRAPFSPSNARRRRTWNERVRHIIAEVKAYGDRALFAADAGIRPPRSRQGRHARAPRRKSRRRRKRASRRRSPRSSSRATASRPITCARSRRTSASPTRSASRWVRAGPRSRRSGLYVPGGTAAYPSSVLMNAVPAKVAGCARLVMVVPAPDGKLIAAGAGGGQARRRRRDLSHRRRAGGGGARLRHRDDRSRWPRSSGPATPMWRRPSAWCSARSAST